MRRLLVLLVVAILIGGSVAGSPSPITAGASSGPGPVLQRPNILVVVVDDQRAGEGTLRVMPSTRRWLGRSGVRFSQAFATTPLCCPSRASIFTGKYAHNHGVFTNLGPLKFRHRFTIQNYLQDAGYKTAMAGKFFNSWPLSDRPPHFDKWASFPGGFNGASFNVNGTIRTVPGYSTRFIARKSADFIESFERRDNQPWLMYAATYAPHAPFIPEERYEGTPVPGWKGNPAVFEKDRSDKPPYVLLRNESYQTWRRNRRLQLRSLKSVDDMMRRLRVKLRNLDEASNTLVIYMSDNGYMWADHGLYDKGAPYTPSIRIPMLMRPPGGLAHGRVDRRLVGNIDVAPTILDAAGELADPLHPMDGRSLLDETWERDRILTEYRNNDNMWTPPTWASLRTDDYQYVEYYDDGKRIFREYYNLEKDPWQLRNLLRDRREGNDPSPATLRLLSAQVSADRDCEGPTCP